MADNGETGAKRRPRADAERNRLRLLEAAKQALAEKGAAVSLEEIARLAGVGIGTLYRHFATREALVEAVYRNEADNLIAAAARLAHSAPPVEALRQWLSMFVDYMTTKRGVYEALGAVGGASGPRLSGAKPSDAVKELVERAAAAGAIRWHDDPVDLLRALAGVANAGERADGAAAAKRMIDVLIAGMRQGR